MNFYTNMTSNMIIEFFNWKLTLTLGDVKTVRFQIQQSICIQDSIEKLAPIFFFPLQLNLISAEIVLRSTAISRRNREHEIELKFGINPSSKWWIQMDLACCMHTDSQFINKKRNPVDKGCSKKPSRIDVSTVHHHHHHHRRPATFVLGMLTLSRSHQIASWLVQRILYSIAKSTPISGGGTPAYLDLLAGHWVVICGNREMKISFKAC
jgi:hypothetical protein